MQYRHFRDRTEAGEELAKILVNKDYKNPVVLALPRGGVPVAAPIARALKAPLELIMVKKIGMPGHAEYAIGAVVDGAKPHVVVNRRGLAESGLTDADINRLAQEKLEVIEQLKREYGVAKPLSVAGRTAIIVDDGIATGSSVKAAIEAMRAQKPTKIVLAMPVAPRSTITELAVKVDDVVCLYQPEPFFAVGAHYLDFRQVSDETVRKLMQDLATTGHRQH